MTEQPDTASSNEAGPQPEQPGPEDQLGAAAAGLGALLQELRSCSASEIGAVLDDADDWYRHLTALHQQVRIQHTEAVRAKESAEARRKVAWARHFSARRATVWIIGTIHQQLRYGAWRPGEVVEYLADLAALWEPNEDPVYRAQHAPASWLTPLPRLGFDLLRRFDQWEAVDIAVAVLPVAKAGGNAIVLNPVHVTEDMLTGVDEETFDEHQANMRAALEQVIAALHHGIPDQAHLLADDPDEG